MLEDALHHVLDLVGVAHQLNHLVSDVHAVVVDACRLIWPRRKNKSRSKEQEKESCYNMGLFSKLFGTKQVKPIRQAPAIPALEMSTSFSSHYVDVRQKTSGALAPTPISAWDGYTSPSGGYVNYGRFQVIGKNPSTNRKNKRTYEVKSEEDACKCAEEAGLIGPFEVSALPAIPPTDAQLSYAKDLGATIPEGACKTDVSAIISRITDEDESPASEGLARKAHECGVKFSRYHGRKGIVALARDLPSNAYIEIMKTM